MTPVYPCTYRELEFPDQRSFLDFGISLYLQGTQIQQKGGIMITRYIPVPTGNSITSIAVQVAHAVYPCTYRELHNLRPFV